jgi:hypothetical protein
MPTWAALEMRFVNEDLTIIKFEVLTAVKMWVPVFWILMTCHL